MDMNVANARNGSVGLGSTSHINNTNGVLILRTSMFGREERQSDVLKNGFKMSDRVKLPHCAMQGVFFQAHTRDYRTILY